MSPTPPQSQPLPLPIPINFTRKKAKILQDLSVPAGEYSDRSPKGTVDEGIRELIDEINAYDGLVTTSSCAGRISVFLEGGSHHDYDQEGRSGDSRGGGGGEAKPEEERKGPTIGPGGKGAGRFLFVSHKQPLDVTDAADDDDDKEADSLSSVFGGGSEPPGLGGKDLSDSQIGIREQRFVRFAFEPMILHVMAASLHHAKPLLNAAINSGFRESGVQSLKNLDDPEACPVVAVRTAGLGFEAVIGLAGTDGEEINHNIWPQVQYLVSREYRRMLLTMAKDRFVANTQRIDRFRVALRGAIALEREKMREAQEWESPDARRRRKREAGLRRKRAAANLSEARANQDSNAVENEDGQGYTLLQL